MHTSTRARTHTFGLPIATEVETIHPSNPLVPIIHLQERVRRGARDGKGALVQGGVPGCAGSGRGKLGLGYFSRSEWQALGEGW